MGIIIPMERIRKRMEKKEYIERAKAIEAAKKAPIAFMGTVNALMDLIEDIPAADVRPVVLCKDCRHRDPEDHKCDSGQLERAGCVFPVDDDYFCAYGEKWEES